MDMYIHVHSFTCTTELMEFAFMYLVLSQICLFAELAFLKSKEEVEDELCLYNAAPDNPIIGRKILRS